MLVEFSVGSYGFHEVSNLSLSSTLQSFIFIRSSFLGFIYCGWGSLQEYSRFIYGQLIASSILQRPSSSFYIHCKEPSILLDKTHQLIKYPHHSYLNLDFPNLASFSCGEEAFHMTEVLAIKGTNGHFCSIDNSFLTSFHSSSRSFFKAKTVSFRNLLQLSSLVVENNALHSVESLTIEGIFIQ